MSVLIAVYAKDDEHSFNEIPDLIDRAFTEVHDPKSVIVILVGNKSDLEGDVEDSKAEELVKKDIANEFYAVSAKNGTNVKEMFASVARKLLE